MPLAGGFRAPLPLPWAAGGGTIIPVQVGAATPVQGRDLVSLLDIQKEAQILRQGMTYADLPSKPGKEINKSTSDFGRNLFQALNAIQHHSNTTDQRLRNLSVNVNSLGLKRDPGGNIFFSGATFFVRTGTYQFSVVNGFMTFPTIPFVPNTDNIPNSHAVFYVDESGNFLTVYVRYSDGTLKIAQIPLV